MPDRPISVTEFEDRTSLVVEAIMGTVFEAPLAKDLTAEQRLWFTEHVGWRIRWLYTNYPGFKKVLEIPEAREVVYAYAEGWLEMYVLDPESYQWIHVSDARFFDPSDARFFDPDKEEA